MERGFVCQEETFVTRCRKSQLVMQSLCKGGNVGRDGR